jgi:hypothetical protein
MLSTAHLQKAVLQTSSDIWSLNWFQSRGVVMSGEFRFVLASSP